VVVFVVFVVFAVLVRSMLLVLVLVLVGYQRSVAQCVLWSNIFDVLCV